MNTKTDFLDLQILQFINDAPRDLRKLIDNFNAIYSQRVLSGLILKGFVRCIWYRQRWRQARDSCTIHITFDGRKHLLSNQGKL